VWRSAARGRERRGTIVWVLAFMTLLLATAFAAYTYGRSQSPAALSKEDRESLALYAEAFDTVRDGYVDQEAIDSKTQTYGAIEGMLDTLGDNGHTRFLTPEEVEKSRDHYSGKYVGVGVTLENEDGEAVVAAPIEGSPAEKAGIKPGDVVVAVDGESVRDEGLSEVVEKVKGSEGTAVKLTILRDEEKRIFDLERAEIEVPVASWSLIPNSDVAYVQLASFLKDSPDQLKGAMNEARAAGARHFIVDLRNNTGGWLEQAEEIAAQFLPAGSVIYIRKNKNGEEDKVVVPNGNEPADAPLVILVNGGTASASEILVGALRDNDRALVIGETTVGTGTTLKEYTLKDGSAILLGVAEWLTPDGDFIRETGIVPDIKVPLKEGAELLTPDETRSLSKEEILKKDAQLRRAFEELQNQ
jgi:carboxyl-terminal processing protease